MRILVTSSRMPFALDLIRKLGKEGHAVFATDTFRTAPGSHSKFLAGRRVIASLPDAGLRRRRRPVRAR